MGQKISTRSERGIFQHVLSQNKFRDALLFMKDDNRFDYLPACNPGLPHLIQPQITEKQEYPYARLEKSLIDISGKTPFLYITMRNMDYSRTY